MTPNDSRSISLSDARVWVKGLRHLKSSDAVLRQALKNASPIKLKLERDYFRALVESIIFQQLAGKAAQAVLNRFIALYGNAFPQPKDILNTPSAKLRSAGLSPQKTSYLMDLSKKVEAGELDLQKLPLMRDAEIVTQLDAVKGIGRWTAQMFLIFSLGRTNVLPSDDLGLCKAIQKIYGKSRLPTPQEIDKMAKPWHPYCTLATLYLWRGVDDV